MEGIFESLENLNVSEECFDEIMGIVEELLSEKVSQKVFDTKRQREKNYDNTTYGTPEHELASKKLERNKQLTDKKVKRSGTTSQKADYFEKENDGLNPKGDKSLIDNLLQRGFTLKQGIDGKYRKTKY